MGIKIDNKLNFNNLLMKYAKKAGQKLNALSKVAPYMDLPKRCMLLNAFFFLSQFSYSPSVWIFHCRGTNNKINMLHERCLRIIYSDTKDVYESYIAIQKMFTNHNSDTKSTFTELSKNKNSVSIHKRNLRFLAIEIFKFKRGLAPALRKESTKHTK